MGGCPLFQGTFLRSTGTAHCQHGAYVGMAVPTPKPPTGQTTTKQGQTLDTFLSLAWVLETPGPIWETW